MYPMMADLEKKVNAIQLQALFKLLQYQALPPNKKSKCRKFSNEPQIDKYIWNMEQVCHEYKIYGGLLASFKNKSWKFVNNKIPFMNNEPTTIDSLGIDRETFQKLFQTLHHEYLDPTNSWNQAKTQQLQKVTPIVSLYGLYNERERKFL